MDELECLSDNEITKEYIGMFFNNMVKHIDIETQNNIKNKYIETYRWYLNTYHINFDLFGYGLLTYLIFLSDNNLIDDYTLDSLAEVAPFSGSLSILDVHFFVNYPKVYHDTYPKLYYENMRYWVSSQATFYDISFLSKEKLVSLCNYYKKIKNNVKDYLKKANYNDYLEELIIYLYQSDEYNEDNYYILFNNLENDYASFIEDINLNGIWKTSNIDNIEKILDSYIKKTLNGKKLIK